MTDLLGCPFCGGEAELREDDGRCCIVCLSVDCFTAMGEGYDRDAMPSHAFYDRHFAIAAWNTRATPALSCPDGFRVVPVEPDLGMYRALTARLWETDAGKDFAIKWSLGSFREDYQAMLAASPAPAQEPT